jgi:hypothetical protein
MLLAYMFFIYLFFFTVEEAPRVIIQVIIRVSSTLLSMAFQVSNVTCNNNVCEIFSQCRLDTILCRN